MSAVLEAPVSEDPRQEQRCALFLRFTDSFSRAGSSTISPLSMEITRSITLRAKPNSCATQIMVIPSLAMATITSSTSANFHTQVLRTAGESASRRANGGVYSYQTDIFKSKNYPSTSIRWGYCSSLRVVFSSDSTR